MNPSCMSCSIQGILYRCTYWMISPTTYLYMLYMCPYMTYTYVYVYTQVWVYIYTHILSCTDHMYTYIVYILQYVVIHILYTHMSVCRCVCICIYSHIYVTPLTYSTISYDTYMYMYMVYTYITYMYCITDTHTDTVHSIVYRQCMCIIWQSVVHVYTYTGMYMRCTVYYMSYVYMSHLHDMYT